MSLRVFHDFKNFDISDYIIYQDLKIKCTFPLPSFKNSVFFCLRITKYIVVFLDKHTK